MGIATSTALVWFRRDLRVQDNPSLNAALKSGGQVVALYIHSPEEQGEWSPGGASRWYLHHSLLALQSELAAIGVRLLCRTGNVQQVLTETCRQINVETTFWNQVIEPGQLALEEKIQTTLKAAGVTVEISPDDTLLLPQQALKSDGTPYKVFTPFWRNVQQRLQYEDFALRLSVAPQAISQPLEADPQAFKALQLLDQHDWHSKLHPYWNPGEQNSLKLFSDFIQKGLPTYETARDFPAESGTSVISAALHFGEISVARIYDYCRTLLLHESHPETVQSIKRFMAEIGWREFSRHLLHAFPDSHSESLNRRFEQPEAWELNQSDQILHRWQQGETGVPLVDAGMRQLWQTGWMHNRVRMVVASFLTKNLGIHWLHGARWFWDTLVDADLASNTMGWQWVAGCGADAAPYFRVFNPELQAKKFDPRGKYIQQWLGDEILTPTLVDLKISRERALERYQTFIRN